MGSDGNQPPDGPMPPDQIPPGWSQPDAYPPPYTPPQNQPPFGAPPEVGQQPPPHAAAPWPQQPGYRDQPVVDQPYGAPYQQQGGYGYEAASYGYGTTPVAAPTDGMAIASLVLGITSFVCFGPLASLPGLIVGIMAKKKIDESNGLLAGRGLAIAGMVISAINLAFVVMYVLFFVVAFASSA